MKDVVIIHYNTQELTSAAIRSLIKQTPDCKITVFDNSDRRPFDKMGNPRINVIDNTRGQVVDFERWLSSFPDKAPSPENNYASAKHCKSVDCCFDLFPSGFVLMDSDVLVRQDISRFFDPDYAWIGQVKMHKSRYGIRLPRVLPFLCWLNVPLLRNHGVRYCNDQKMWSLSNRRPDMGYDTGCWFYEDACAKHLPFKSLGIEHYIIHLGHASWRDRDAGQWLEENKDLWTT